MADESMLWNPLLPGEVMALFGELRVPWWIAGGWAIDLSNDAAAWGGVAGENAAWRSHDDNTTSGVAPIRRRHGRCN